MPEGRDTTPELGLPQTVREAVEAALRAEGYDDDGGIVSTVATKRRADVPRGDVSGRRQPQAMKRNPPSSFWPARTAQEKRGPWCLKRPMNRKECADCRRADEMGSVGYHVCACGRYSQETQGLCACGRQR